MTMTIQTAVSPQLLACAHSWLLLSLLCVLIFEPQVPAGRLVGAGVLVFPHSCTYKNSVPVFSTDCRSGGLGLFGLVSILGQLEESSPLGTLPWDPITMPFSPAVRESHLSILTVLSHSVWGVYGLFCSAGSWSTLRPFSF